MFSNLPKKRYINFRPFLFIALSCVTGICCAYFFVYRKNLLLSFFLLVFIAIMLLYYFLSNDNFGKKGKFIFSFLCLIVVLITFFSFIIRFNDYKNTTFNNYYLQVNGKVKEVQTLDNQMQKVVLTDISVTGAIQTSTRYNMNLYVTNGELDNGDCVSFSANILDYKDTYQNRFSASFLSENIKFYSYVSADKISVIHNNKNIFERVNCFIRDTLKQGMDDDEFAISYSLLVGKSEVIDDEVISSFRNTGVAHIFAVSGLHIGFLAMTLSFVFEKLKINKILSSFLTIIILFFYSGVCGFTPSSIRAVVMCAIVIIAKLSGQKYDIISSLSLAFILILFYCPFQLFCVGFQLSFCAVLGIVFFNDKFSKIFGFLPNKIASLLSVSISAQTLTLPILLLNFKKVSYISVFINVLFIPIISILFTALFTLVIIGGIFSIAKITLFIPSFIVKGIKYAIMFCDRDFFLVYVLVFTLPLICYYLVCAVLSGYINFKKIIKIVSSVCLSIIVVGSTIVLNVNDKQFANITFTANESIFAVAIERGNKTSIVVNKYSNNFYPSKLLNTINSSNVENLIICDETKGRQSIYNCVSRFAKYYKIKNIFVSCDEQLLKALQNSFSHISFYPMENYAKIVIDDIALTTFTQTSGVRIDKKEKSILVLSSLNSNLGEYSKLKGKYNLVVLTENAINLSKILLSNETIFYGKNNDGYSVLRDGTYKIKI